MKTINLSPQLNILKFALSIILLCLFVNLTPLSFKLVAQNSAPTSNSYKGVVINVLEESKNTNGGYYQMLEVKISDSELQGQVFKLENGSPDSPVTQKFKKGDNLVLTGFQDADGNTILFVDDYVRHAPLITLFIIFCIVAFVVAGKRGITSFVGMLLTFILIFTWVLPKIGSGSNALLVTLAFSIVAIPITFYLSHGISAKTHAAIIGTFIALTITVILSAIFVNSAKLTGFTSDESSFLQVVKGGSFNMSGLLLAGIIVGLLGVLDDITVSQSAIVFQLKNANRRLTFSELFSRAMDVGKDHIASMINTLVLVYAGASLPLLLLFTDSTKTFGEVVNYEIIASEIVRTLIGSTGLVLAVPITTLIAASIVDFKMGGEKK